MGFSGRDSIWKGKILILCIVFICAAVLVSVSSGQLVENNLGYAFENYGFFNNPTALSYDGARNRLAVADKGRELVYIFDLSGQSWTVLGKHQDIKRPSALAFDLQGDLYIIQTDSPLILCFKYGADIADTIDISMIDDIQVKGISKICIDLNKRIYIADWGNAAIYIIDSSGKLIKTITDKLKQPNGILVRPSGELIVADKGFDPVLLFSAGGEFERRLSRPEPSTARRNFKAAGLALDQRGWIYTLNLTNFKIAWFDPTGVNMSEWAPEKPPFFPVDIAIDKYDNIFILESSEGRIRIFQQGE